MAEYFHSLLPHVATALYIVLCVVLFSVAIAIHEFGHFIVALKLGLRVERFSIGFGPALWKKTWKGVEYRISAIPFGGYVSIPDVDPEGTKALEGGGGEKREKIPAWKEILVAVAGPGMNIVLAAVLAVILALVPSARFGELPAVIGGVIPDTPAAAASLQSGDRVLAVGGKSVSTWSELLTEIQIADVKDTEFLVKRGEEEIVLTIKPVRDEVTGACLIGAFSLKNENGSVAWMPARNPIKQLAWDAGSIFRILKALGTPKEMKATGKALGGPVMIAENIYQTIRRDFWDGIGFLRFLNVNLAVLNLLPIPVLDGGLVMFALIALIFRRRVPEKIVSATSTFFMVVLLGLMLFLVYRDSMRSWRIHHAESELEQRAAVEEGGGADASPDESAQGR